MLRRALDIALDNPAPEGYTIHDLITMGVDYGGVQVFEWERDAAMKQRKPVCGFTTPLFEIDKMAMMANLQPPYSERLKELLVRERALGKV